MKSHRPASGALDACARWHERHITFDDALGPRVDVTGKGFTPEVLDKVRALNDVAEVHAENGRVNIRLTHAIEVAPIVSLLVHSGAGIEEVRKGSANLEETFLTLMNNREEEEAVA